jgi:hypothetical protein
MNIKMHGIKHNKYGERIIIELDVANIRWFDKVDAHFSSYNDNPLSCADQDGFRVEFCHNFSNYGGDYSIHLNITAKDIVFMFTKVFVSRSLGNILTLLAKMNSNEDEALPPDVVRCLGEE